MNAIQRVPRGSGVTLSALQGLLCSVGDEVVKQYARLAMARIRKLIVVYGHDCRTDFELTGSGYFTADDAWNIYLVNPTV